MHMDTLKVNLKEDILRCPITKTYFHVPVLCKDGHFYEKAAIKKWLSENSISPMTKEKICTQFYRSYLFEEILNISYRTLLVGFIEKENSMLEIMELINYFYKKIIKFSKDDTYFHFLCIIFENYGNKMLDMVNGERSHTKRYSEDMQFIHYICIFGRLELLKKCIKKPFDIEAQANRCRPIHLICSNKTRLIDSEQVNSIELLSNKVDLEAEDDEGRRPIHIVCSNNTNLHTKFQLRAIGILAKKGVNLEAVAKNSWRPIHFICSQSTNLNNYRIDALEILMNKGIDPTLSTKTGKTPIDIILETNVENDMKKKIIIILKTPSSIISQGCDRILIIILFPLIIIVNLFYRYYRI